MSQLVNIEVDILAYDSGGISNDPSDATKISNTAISNQTFSNLSRQIITLPAGGSLQAIALPETTCDFVMLFADQNINIQLNGGSTQNLLSLLPTVKTPLFMFAGSVTSLQAQSASVSIPANLDVWFLVG